MHRQLQLQPLQLQPLLLIAQGWRPWSASRAAVALIHCRGRSVRLAVAVAVTVAVAVAIPLMHCPERCPELAARLAFAPW